MYTTKGAMYTKKVIKGIDVFCGFCKISMKVHRSRIKQNKLSYICCSHECRSKLMSCGNAGYGFKKTFKDLGYKTYYRYKIKTVNGLRIYEHRWVMQEHIGRILQKNEFIHHINGDTKDNRIENLMIVNSSSHGKIEFSTKERIYKK